jgi:hypothetical protein
MVVRICAKENDDMGGKSATVVEADEERGPIVYVDVARMRGPEYAVTRTGTDAIDGGGGGIDGGGNGF